MRRLSLLLAGLLAVAPSNLVGQPALDPPPSQRQVEWAKEVEAGNYFFWQRFAYRLTRKDEFDLDERWYQPNRIVDGGFSAPMPRVSAPRVRIEPAGWERARAFAFAHNTHALVAMRDGNVEYEAYAAGHERGRVERVNSFSKTIVALLVGIAIADGRIRSADQRIGDFLTEWSRDPRGDITIRQLLQEASGLEKVAFGTKDPDNKMLRLAEDRDVDAAALAFDLVDRPGTKFSYNSVNTQLAGTVLTRATGIDYTQYLSNKLWRPLGNGPGTLNVDGRGKARAFCCMRSQAEDWLRVGQMILDRGRWQGRQIVPAAWIAEMMRPSPNNPYFGMQLSIGRSGTSSVSASDAALMVHPQRQPYGVDDVVFLTGANFVNLWIVPSRRLVVLRLGEFHPDYDTPAIPNHLLGSLK